MQHVLGPGGSHGTGSRPPGVRRWVNLAEAGDQGERLRGISSSPRVTATGSARSPADRERSPSADPTDPRAGKYLAAAAPCQAALFIPGPLPQVSRFVGGDITRPGVVEHRLQLGHGLGGGGPLQRGGVTTGPHRQGPVSLPSAVPLVAQPLLELAQRAVAGGDRLLWTTPDPHLTQPDSAGHAAPRAALGPAYR